MNIHELVLQPIAAFVYCNRHAAACPGCRPQTNVGKVKVTSNWKPVKGSRPSVPHGAKFFTYLLLPSVCAHTEENVETVNDLVLSQEDKLQTHRSVLEISRETGIHRLSLSRIICKDLHLKCFKRRRAQELKDANCAARMKHAEFLLQNFPQYTTNFVSFTDEKVFSVASSDSRQNKVSGRLQ